MTRNPIRRSGLVLLSLLLPLSPLSAEDVKDLRELLRDALYTEEVTRDPESAAKQYEALLSQHDSQRAFAASALFRLAEVRRKQDRKDEAISLYQKLLARFPEAETEAKLARESLAALGGQLPSPEASVVDSDDQYIEQLRKIAETSPDRLQEKFLEEVTVGKPKVVEFLISQGVDPKTPDALTEAAATGNLAVCKILLQHGKPLPVEAGNALAMTISKDRGAVLNYLLEQGLDPNSPVSWGVEPLASPLMVAIGEGNADAAKALLDRGANVDFMVQSKGYPVNGTGYFGTALHKAVWSRNLPMFRFLLEHGAKPDLPTPNAGITPLHLAASSTEPDAEIMVKELLARGADPNRKTTLPLPDTANPNQVPREFSLVTPFQIALGNDSGAAMVEAMIAKGANANLLDRDGHTLLTEALRNKDAKRIDLLLRAKADPDLAGKDGGTPLTLALYMGEVDVARRLLDAGADPNKPHGSLTPLTAACQMDGDSRWPLAEMLLAKGAKPGAGDLRMALSSMGWDLALRMLDAGAPLPESLEDRPGQTPFIRTLRFEKAMPVIQRMLEMGVKLDDGWIDSGFTENYYSTASTPIARPVRSYLFRTLMLPRLEASGSIRCVQQEEGGTSVTLLAEKSAAGRPAPLAQLLLDPKQELRWTKRVKPTDRLTIWRRSGEQWIAAHEFALDANSEYPALEWGDVIELSDGPETDRGKVPNDLPMTPQLAWSLRQRVSFPVKVEIEGVKRDVMLRGDRLVFDPAFPDQVPLVGARKLAQILWAPDFDPWESTLRMESGKGEVIIRREGWSEVRIPFFDTEKDFPLQAGDEISLKSVEISPEERQNLRHRKVTLKALGAPYARYFGDNMNDGPDPRSIPSLIQIVAEAFSGLNLPNPPDDPAALPAWLLKTSPDLILTYLQRPDLSRLRIRRLQDDGTETILNVDLTKAIEETPADAAHAQVRQHDMILQAGDIVEVPVAPPDAGKPWTGLSAKEEAFFSKALSSRIQLTDSDGRVGMKDLIYRAPRIVPTSAGAITLLPKEGVSSMTGWGALRLGNDQGYMVNRDGVPEFWLSAGSLFLREGDRVTLPQRSGQRVVRDRFVPPPAPPPVPVVPAPVARPRKR
ncbi:MAG TPA: ankyrin repeat domain-containing protein [Haloferula sp.]